MRENHEEKEMTNEQCRNDGSHGCGRRPCRCAINHWPLVIASFCLFSGCWPAAQQAAKPPEFVGVRVGFGDHYKVGLWTPVE